MSITLPPSTEGATEDDASVADLTPLLDNPIRRVRLFAIESLRRLGDASAIPALLDAAGDPHDVESAELAAHALRDFLSLSAIPLLAHGTLHPNARARLAAVRALRDLRSIGALPALLRAAGDEDVEVRREALTALGHLRSPEILPALRSALDDPDLPTRLHALAGLAHFASPQALGLLIHALKDAHWQVRRDATVLIARFPYGASAPALLRLLGDPDWRVVREALLSLAHLRAPFSAYYLPLITHEIPDVRIAAANAIAETKDNLAVGALNTLADDDDDTVRQCAIKALAKLIDPGDVWP